MAPVEIWKLCDVLRCAPDNTSFHESADFSHKISTETAQQKKKICIQNLDLLGQFMPCVLFGSEKYKGRDQCRVAMMLRASSLSTKHPAMETNLLPSVDVSNLKGTACRTCGNFHADGVEGTAGIYPRDNSP
jgi:hypothetical protein